MEETKTVELAPNVVARLNVKAIGCNRMEVAARQENDRSELLLCRVIGFVTALIFGTNEDESEYIALGGRFQGENKQASTDDFGKMFESGVCFLPPGMMENVIASCRKIGIVEPEKTDKRSKKVEKPLVNGAELTFAIDIYVRRDSNASGITYVGHPLLEPTAHDPMVEIRKAIAATEAKLQAQLAATAGGGTKQVAPGAPKQIEAPVKAKR